MMTNIYYATLYFKYPVPTPIDAEHTNKILKLIKQELRANASSVETNLGGSGHKYLRLYLFNIEHVKIDPTPTSFVELAWHGTLVINAETTAVEAIHTKETYHEVMCVFRECQNAKKKHYRIIRKMCWSISTSNR